MTNLEQSQWYAVQNSAGTWEVGTSPERFGQTFATFHENVHIGVTAEVAEHHARLFAAARGLEEVVRAMASFDGRNNNHHLKEMAKAALAKVENHG